MAFRRHFFCVYVCLESSTTKTFCRAIEKDLTQLGSSRFPNIICPKGHQARTYFFAAFKRYYKAKGHEDASRLIQARFELQKSYKLSEEDIAQCDINVCLGLLINTVPATFWTLYHVFSQPSLLQKARRAITSHVQVSADGLARKLNIAAVATHCPLIDSIVQETLRVHSANTAPRYVLEDTVLNDKYLMKQGSAILTPSGELHKASSFWGSTAEDFDARRFCSKNASENKKPGSVFRPWGGGTFLCPGRFLAKNEIIILLVIMVLKYDMETLDGKPWSPPAYQWNLTASILAPKRDVRVNVREREGDGSTCWTFEWNQASVPAL